MLSYTFMASERSWLKDKAAGPGCAQPTYERDGWLGARTAHCMTTVLAEAVYMSWGSRAFVPHSKSPQHLNPSLVGSREDHEDH